MRQAPLACPYCKAVHPRRDAYQRRRCLTCGARIPDAPRQEDSRDAKGRKP